MTAPALDRRTAIGIALGAGLAASGPVRASTGSSGIRALAFDGFTIFDPRAVTSAVMSVVPDRGAALAAAWTSKAFALSWLETSAGRYSGFAALADAALEFSVRTFGLELSAKTRRDLIGVFFELPAWPDAAHRLEQLRKAGIRLAFLSNLSEPMLTSNMRRNDLTELMEPPLSTDQVKAFKPAQRAYAMGPTYFRLPKREIGFVAFGGWDALGAKWFGYRTAWINRLGLALETLDPNPDTVATDLSAAVRLVDPV